MNFKVAFELQQFCFLIFQLNYRRFPCCSSPFSHLHLVDQ